MPQRVRKQDTRGPERGEQLRWAHTSPTPRQGSPACTPGLQGGTRRLASPPPLLLHFCCLLPLLRTPLQQDVSQLRRHEVGSLLRAVIPFQVLTWAPPRNRQGKRGWSGRGGGKGGREEQGSQQAWKRGREKRKTKNRQMERPELVAATDPSRPPLRPPKAENSEAEGPGRGVPAAAALCAGRKRRGRAKPQCRAASPWEAGGKWQVRV